MRLAVKVVPGSSREEVAGWLGEELKVRVRQVAQAGKANEAVRQLLAKTLGVATADVRIVSGAGSPHKVIDIHGLDAGQIRERIGG